MRLGMLIKKGGREPSFYSVYLDTTVSSGWLETISWHHLLLLWITTNHHLLRLRVTGHHLLLLWITHTASLSKC